MAWLAECYVNQNKYQLAEPLARRIISLRPITVSESSQSFDSDLDDRLRLARTLYKGNKRNDALPIYESIIHAYEKQNKEWDFNTISTFAEYSVCLESAGNYGAAELLERRIIDSLKKQHAQYTPASINATLILMRVHSTEAKFDEANQIAEQLLSAVNNGNISEEAQKAIIFMRIGYLYGDQKLFEKQSEDLLLKALDISSKNSPNSSTNVEVLLVLGTYYSRIGNDSKAMPLFQNALSILKTTNRLRSLLGGWALQEVGHTQVIQSLYEQAIPNLELALSLRQELLGPNSSITSETTTTLAYAYIHMGRFEKANELLQITVQQAGPLTPQNASTIRNCYEAMGFMQYSSGKNSDAEFSYKKSD